MDAEFKIIIKEYNKLKSLSYIDEMEQYLGSLNKKTIYALCTHNAKNGDSIDMYNMGWILYIYNDFNDAYLWFKKSADLENSDAIYYLAKLYNLYNIGDTSDFDLYIKSANLGNKDSVAAICDYGLTYDMEKLEEINHNCHLRINRFSLSNYIRCNLQTIIDKEIDNMNFTFRIYSVFTRIQLKNEEMPALRMNKMQRNLVKKKILSALDEFIIKDLSDMILNFIV